MTWYPSAAIEREKIENARERLGNMQGQPISGEELFNIFGAYYHTGDSAAEARGAFKAICNEGLLIEESPGNYRVAAEVHPETKYRIVEKATQIEQCIIESARVIKDLVMSELADMHGDFPLIPFVVKQGKKNIKKNLPAIKLNSCSGNSCDNQGVFLTPLGLFYCETGYADLEPRFSGKWSGPSWEKREELPHVWIKHGDQALAELARHRRYSA